MGSLPSVMPRLRRGAASLGRLDRLGWAAGMCFAAYGHRVGVRVSEPRLLECLPPHLPPGWTPSSWPVVDELFSLWVDANGKRAPRLSRVYAGRRRRARTASLGQALEVLESEIRQSVAAAAPRRTFVHAGVVGWRGRAILLPGRSRSGKTTLTAELVRAGATYYSDEFAVLDSRGRVYPFAKPLSLREEGRCDAHTRRRRAEELGGVAGSEPLPVGLVVLAAFRPGAAWRPERLSAGRAVLEMLVHTVPARLRPAASLDALGRAVARADVLMGERGEAREMVQGLLEQVETAERAPRPRTGERGMR